MSRPVTTYVLLVAVLLGLWALASAVRRVALPGGAVVGVVALEASLVLVALADGSSLLLGHHTRQLPVHIAYLLTSIGLLPVLLGTDRQRWRPSAVTIGCAAVAVVLARMWSTWRG